jgi:hypothetical protein
VPRLRSTAVLGLGLVACASLGGDLEDVEEPDGESPSLAVVPWGSTITDRDAEERSGGDASADDALDCPLWAATSIGAEHREAVRALCWAPTFDSGSVGYAGQRTASREALECLLDLDVPTRWFVTLSRAKNPVTRAYAREAIHRRDAWTRELVQTAIMDSVTIPAREGCSVYPMNGSELGYAGAVGRDDVRIDPLLLESDLLQDADRLDRKFRREFGCQRPRIRVPRPK